MKTSDLFTEFRNPSIQYRMLPLFRVNDDVVQEEIEWQVRANKRDGGHRPMAAATGAVEITLLVRTRQVRFAAIPYTEDGY